MEKRKIIARVCFAIFTLLCSYFVYMGFQGLLTLISKQGTLILPFLGPVFMFIEIVGMMIILYHEFFNKDKIGKNFYFNNGIYLLINSSLATVFMFINLVTYKNWSYGGPTLLYPIDYLLMSLLGLAYGVCLILEYKKNKDKEDVKGDKVIIKIGKAIYTFLALDRIGVLLVMVFSAHSILFVSIIPILFLSMIPMAYIVMDTLKGKLNNKGKIIYLSVLLGVWVLTNVYQVVMLLGDDSCQFMKVLSPFYGLDRISTLPITYIASSLVTLIPVAFSFVKMLLPKNSKK